MINAVIYTQVHNAELKKCWTKKMSTPIIINPNNFLGRGWSFPPAFSLADGELEMVSDEQDIRESLFILLSTNPGENLLHPDYGCPLHRLVFAPIDGILPVTIRDMVRTAILYYESRIIATDIVVSQNPDQDGRIDILIEYTIVNTNTRTNMVYPFYLNR